MTSTLLTIAAITILLWFIIIYNRFVSLKNQVDAAWSDISVQLKRRHDLIPKLVEVVQQYTSYEQAILDRITTLRSAGKKLEDINKTDLNKTAQIEQTLTEQLHRIIILSEDYPDLKASQHFIELQKELSVIEDTLQHARRFYNGVVRLLNTRIDTFPDLILAKVFNYKYRVYFQVEMK